MPIKKNNQQLKFMTSKIAPDLTKKLLTHIAEEQPEASMADEERQSIETIVSVAVHGTLVRLNEKGMLK